MIHILKHEIIVARFPISHDSHESKNSFYRSAMRMLIRSLSSGIPCLFRLVVEHTSTSQSCMFADFQNIVAVQAQGSFAKDLIDLAFQMVKSLTMPRAYNVGIQLLLPLLENCPTVTLLNAGKDEIVWLDSVLHNKIGHRETQRRNTFLQKNLCFEVLRILFDRLQKNQVYSKNSPLVCSFAPEAHGNNALTKPVLESALEARKVSEAAESNKAAHSRYRQSSVALLAAVLNRIDAPALLFEKLLFSENLDRGENLWNCVVDFEVFYPQQ